MVCNGKSKKLSSLDEGIPIVLGSILGREFHRLGATAENAFHSVDILWLSPDDGTQRRTASAKQSAWEGRMLLEEALHQAFWPQATLGFISHGRLLGASATNSLRIGVRCRNLLTPLSVHPETFCMSWSFHTISKVAPQSSLDLTRHIWLWKGLYGPGREAAGAPAEPGREWYIPNESHFILK